MKNLFKYASLLAVAAVLFACGGEDPEQKDEFILSADKYIVQTFDGDCATLAVTLNGEPVTENVVFFKGKGKDKEVVDIPDFTFSTTEPGEHYLTATYGTYISEEIVIKAISVTLPETPADPKPGGMDFKARVLATQFTTTGCNPCAGLKRLVHKAMEDESLAGRIVLTTCHSGLVNGVKDPSFIQTGYDEFSTMEGFPYMFCDMYYGFDYYPTWTENELKTEFNKLYDIKKDNAAGIAVNSSVKDGQLVAKVTVKPVETGNYRVGMFLLEDGISATQNGAGSGEEYMNTHDGVIRYIDAEGNLGGRQHYYGHSLGKIAPGQTADYVFIWDLEQIWKDGSKKGELYGGTKWHSLETAMANLHLAVFVCTVGTSANGGETYYVSNVIDCPVNGQTPYEYR